MIDEKQYLQIEEYNYDLPEDRIAKYPLNQRDSSKLLIYDGQTIRAEVFKNIGKELSNNTLIIANSSKVVRARLKFQKEGGAKIEVFVLEPSKSVDYESAFAQKREGEWTCFVGNAKRWKKQVITSQTIDSNGDRIILNARIVDQNGPDFKVHFNWTPEHLSWAEIIDLFGSTPIPPYLNRDSDENDHLRYQTLYAEQKGSVAAPTAGLHFTEKVLQDLKLKGLQFQTLVLHVGAGTFKPVSADNVENHEMHGEVFFVDESLITQLLLKEYGVLAAIGTTSMRALESIYYLGCNLLNKKGDPFIIDQWQAYNETEDYTKEECLKAILTYMQQKEQSIIQAYTKIMIVPSFKFKMVDVLITNFHQPKSTLLLLVAAFIGKAWKDVYQFALDQQFRFLSYGDSCLFMRQENAGK